MPRQKKDARAGGRKGHVRPEPKGEKSPVQQAHHGHSKLALGRREAEDYVWSRIVSTPALRQRDVIDVGGSSGGVRRFKHRYEREEKLRNFMNNNVNVINLAPQRDAFDMMRGLDYVGMDELPQNYHLAHVPLSQFGTQMQISHQNQQYEVMTCATPTFTFTHSFYYLENCDFDAMPTGSICFVIIHMYHGPDGTYGQNHASYTGEYAFARTSLGIRFYPLQSGGKTYEHPDWTQKFQQLYFPIGSRSNRWFVFESLASFHGSEVFRGIIVSDPALLPRTHIESPQVAPIASTRIKRTLPINVDHPLFTYLYPKSSTWWSFGMSAEKVMMGTAAAKTAASRAWLASNAQRSDPIPQLDRMDFTVQESESVVDLVRVTYMASLNATFADTSANLQDVELLQSVPSQPMARVRLNWRRFVRRSRSRSETWLIHSGAQFLVGLKMALTSPFGQLLLAGLCYPIVCKLRARYALLNNLLGSLYNRGLQLCVSRVVGVILPTITLPTIPTDVIDPLHLPVVRTRLNNASFNRILSKLISPIATLCPTTFDPVHNPALRMHFPISHIVPRGLRTPLLQNSNSQSVVTPAIFEAMFALHYVITILCEEVYKMNGTLGFVFASVEMIMKWFCLPRSQWWVTILPFCMHVFVVNAQNFRYRNRVFLHLFYNYVADWSYRFVMSPVTGVIMINRNPVPLGDLSNTGMSFNLDAWHSSPPGIWDTQDVLITNTLCLGRGDESEIEPRIGRIDGYRFDGCREQAGATLYGHAYRPVWVARKCACNAHNSLCSRHLKRNNNTLCITPRAFITQHDHTQWFDSLVQAFVVHCGSWEDQRVDAEAVWWEKWSASKRDSIRRSILDEKPAINCVTLEVKFEKCSDPPTKARGIQATRTLHGQFLTGPAISWHQHKLVSFFNNKFLFVDGLSIECCIGCGLTPKQIAQWGFDCRDCVWFYERDFKNYDSHIDVTHFDALLEPFFGVLGPTVLGYLNEMVNVQGRYADHGKTNNFIHYQVNGTCKSGHNHTTSFNSLLNLIVIVIVAVRLRLHCRFIVSGDDGVLAVRKCEVDCDRDTIGEMIANIEVNLGFTPKKRVYPSLDDVTFLNRRWYNAIDSSKVFAPKIGRVLSRLMWSVSKVPNGKALQWRHGVVAGLWGDCAPVPILRDFLVSQWPEILDSTEEERRALVRDRPLATNFERDMCVDFNSSEVSITEISRLYRLSVVECQEFIRHLARLPFGHRALIKHPTAEIIIATDLADLEDRESVDGC